MNETPAANLKLWEWLERHRAETEREAEAAAAQIPALAAAMASMPPDVRETQRIRSRDLQREALVDGNWGPWVDDLIAQGRACAQMGIELDDLYRLLGLLRQPLLDRLPDDPRERRTLFGAWTAYVETAMGILGQTYVAAKSDLVAAAHAHNVELEADNVRLEGDVLRYVQELERSNTELDELASVASHDLRSPLRDIRSLARWITEDLGPDIPDASKRHLALLDERVQRMERLLDDLLEYSRVGRMTGETSDFRLDDALAEVVAFLAPRPGFDVRFEGEAPVLHTPRAPLEKVLRNLVGNAVKHHDRPSGQIVVTSVPATDGRVTVRVTDDGPGIPAEFQERVFRMFQTLRTRDQVEGSGMGLAFVKKTVEWFGGSVAIESAGRGATIRFTWPERWEAAGGGA